MNTKKKVIAYFIRNKNQRREILVFDHEGMPEAGTQVIGGTLEVGEELKSALVREIFEESGISVSTSQLSFLGETVYHRLDRPEVNERTYFFIDGNFLKDSWSHLVISDGEDNGLKFNFYWLSFDQATKILTGNFAECLHLL